MLLVVVLVALLAWCQLGAADDLVPADRTNGEATGRTSLAAPRERAELAGTGEHGAPDATPCLGRVAATLPAEAAATRPLRASAVDLDRFCTADCFPAGTEVTTPDGLRAIDTIRVGERVRSGNGWDVVTGVHRAAAADIVSIDIDGQRLHATPGHVVVTPAGWIAAADLRAESLVVAADGTWHSVARTSRAALPSPVQVFNLQLATANSFAVGSGGVLVRSKDALMPQGTAR